MNTLESDVPPSELQSAPRPDSRATSNRNRWIGALLVLGVVVGGGISWRWFFATSRATQPPTPTQTQMPPRPVEVVTLTAGAGVRQVELLGQVESTEQATIRTQTDGIVRDMLVQPGDRITPGTTLAILDDADQRLALAEAQARFAQERSILARLEVGTRPEIIAQRQAAVQSAQAREQEAIDNLERTTRLVEEGALSERLLIEAKAAVDDAQGERLAAAAALAEAEAGPMVEEIEAQRARVAAAQSAIQQAQLELRRTRITATATGVVQRRHASPGDYLEAADELLTLVAGDRLDAFLEIPEELSGRVAPGMPILLTARALPQWQTRATITGVVPAADPASRRQRVRVQLTNPPQELVSGMAIMGQLELTADTPGFVLSRDALTQRQGQWFVFAVADNTVKPVAVELVADMGTEVAIASEQLAAGQAVVLRGGDGLRDGMPVTIVGENPSVGENP